MRDKAAWLFEQGQPCGAEANMAKLLGVRGVLGGRQRLPRHARRLRLRRRVRRRAQVPRDAPLPGRAGLQQPGPGLPRPARARHAAVVLGRRRRTPLVPCGHWPWHGRRLLGRRCATSSGGRLRGAAGRRRAPSGGAAGARARAPADRRLGARRARAHPPARQRVRGRRAWTGRYAGRRGRRSTSCRRSPEAADHDRAAGGDEEGPVRAPGRARRAVRGRARAFPATSWSSRPATRAPGGTSPR